MYKKMSSNGEWKLIDEEIKEKNIEEFEIKPREGIKKISLNGEWTLIGKDSQSMDIKIPVNVPGYAHQALESAGILEPVFWRDNAKNCQWVEDVEWTFIREFTVDEDTDISFAKLHFDGIDTYADIFLNDKLLHSSSNMFLNIELPVSEEIKCGKNILKVVVYPYKEKIAGKPDCPTAFSSDRGNVRRIQCTFFWDWVDRFVSAGISGNVELVCPTESVIEDVFVETVDICDTSAALKIEVKTKNAVETDCRFSIDITGPEGENAWDLRGNVFTETLYFQADIGNPKLWWPAGYGEQPLYNVVVTLCDSNNNEIDKKTLRVGIRTVRYEMLQDIEGSQNEKITNELRELLNQQHNPNKGESYILLVNGKRIFAKGGNWVPASPFPGTVSEAKYHNLISLAAKGNMNLLRIWGGGIYEPDIFYDLCDEFGIMVTHDFMLACGRYPEDDRDFVDSFKNEVIANVLRLRSHTCIVAWNGNNENGDGYNWDDKNTMNLKLSYMCKKILNELNPNRTYRWSCPYGGLENSDVTVGDNHLSWWWKGAENIDPLDFDKVGRFATESPLEGYPLPSVMEKYLSKEDILDFDSPIVDFHIKNNNHFTAVGLLSVHGRLKKNAEVMVGNGEGKYEQLYRWAYIQYEWARLTLEGARKNKWYTSGVLYWMYNDCWPALGYAVMDYYARPKAGWYATKHSGAPVASAIKEDNGKLRFIVLNDSFKSGKLSYNIGIYTNGSFNNVAKGEAEFGCNINTEFCAFSFDELSINKESNAIVFFDIYDGDELISRARWYPHWLAELSLPMAELKYTVNREHNTISVFCKKGIALGVAFDGEFIAEDNFIDLLEGETREIAYTPLDNFAEITAYGYNSQIEKI